MKHLIFICFTAVSLSVHGEEIRVLSGGAARAFVEPLAATFPGHAVKLEYQPMGRLVQSLAGGYRADMVIVTSEVLPQLERDGRVAAGGGKPVARVDPKTGTSGKHVADVLERLGISEQMKSKTRLGQGGYITEPVGRGEIELGIHQISEILPVKGVRLAGPLPPELQKYTVYVAAPVLDSQKRPAVDAFIAHLGAPEARARLAASGYTPPE
jgi:molybdate transport system substrate-binding protein